MTRGVAHDPELRAEVVNAVLAGLTITQAAAQFKLDKGLVSRWVAGGLQALATQKKRGVVVEERNALLEQLIVEYLTTGLRAMIVQAEVYADEQYCRTQDADKLAIAHGVLGDKLAGVAATAQALGIVGVQDQGDSIEPARVGALGSPENA